jgi:hypothetical protein
VHVGFLTIIAATLYIFFFIIVTASLNIDFATIVAHNVAVLKRGCGNRFELISVRAAFGWGRFLTGWLSRRKWGIFVVY